MSKKSFGAALERSIQDEKRSVKDRFELADALLAAAAPPAPPPEPEPEPAAAAAEPPPPAPKAAGGRRVTVLLSDEIARSVEEMRERFLDERIVVDESAIIRAAISILARLDHDERRTLVLAQNMKPGRRRGKP